MKVLIGGALGRMGRELTASALAAGDEVVCGIDIAWDGSAQAIPMVREASALQAQADVLVDFSHASALPGLLRYAQANGLPLVLCATGYAQAETDAVAAAAQSLPILRSANMSLGINVLEQLAAMAARVLGDGYDIEIVEKHHRQKLDSPSGTALMLYDAVARARGGALKPVFGREGRAAKRGDQEIGIHAVRGGTVTGEHEVGFYGKSEELLLIHRAESRALLAEGALRAARFIVNQPAGLYTMRDVVARMLEA
ncbi:MAG: 4-hydroxy-tetrahydrodipicolinate reductase [Candidatus Limiplasma sp.]|nr:4-hydroxy-tetrahydrodipicolinate reductase [Candidatus Limiplasma sp.]